MHGRSRVSEGWSRFRTSAACITVMNALQRNGDAWERIFGERQDSAYHQISFKPNCTWREVVSVLVIRPAVATGLPLAPNKLVFWTGGAKLARFRMLKNSERNCAWNRSVILMFLKSEVSKSARPGPVRMLRPAL